MHLSDAPATIIGNFKGIFVPFSAFFTADPIHGKRFEVIYDMEKQAAAIEVALEDICGGTGGGTDGFVFDFTKPVAFTPQFGNNPARFSVHGHVCRRDEFTKTPVGERYVDNTGELKYGPGASNASNRVPDAELIALHDSFKAMLEAATGLVVYRLELANYIFGVTKDRRP